MGENMKDFTYRTFTIVFLIFFLGCNDFTQLQKEKSLENPASLQSLKDLKDKSLTYFDGLAYSQQPIVQQIESLENNLSKFYKGFGGIWFDPNDKNKLIVGLTMKGRYASDKADIEKNLHSIIKNRIKKQI